MLLPAIHFKDVTPILNRHLNYTSYEVSQLPVLNMQVFLKVQWSLEPSSTEIKGRGANMLLLRHLSGLKST